MKIGVNIFNQFAMIVYRTFVTGIRLILHVYVSQTRSEIVEMKCDYVEKEWTMKELRYGIIKTVGVVNS